MGVQGALSGPSSSLPHSCSPLLLPPDFLTPGGGGSSWGVAVVTVVDSPHRWKEVLLPRANVSLLHPSHMLSSSPAANCADEKEKERESLVAFTSAAPPLGTGGRAGGCEEEEETAGIVRRHGREAGSENVYPVRGIGGEWSGRDSWRVKNGVK